MFVMPDYAATQRATVEQLRGFNAAATAQAIGQRLRQVANGAPVVCRANFGRASTCGAGYWDRPRDRVANRG